jgi:hypothetical protein
MQPRQAENTPGEYRTATPNVDELHLAVSFDHVMEDIRTLTAVAMLRPNLPPSLRHRLASHRNAPGCPLSALPERRI